MTEIQRIAMQQGYWVAMSTIQSMLQAGIISIKEFQDHRASIAHRA